MSVPLYNDRSVTDLEFLFCKTPWNALTKITSVWMHRPLRNNNFVRSNEFLSVRSVLLSNLHKLLV